MSFQRHPVVLRMGRLGRSRESRARPEPLDAGGASALGNAQPRASEAVRRDETSPGVPVAQVPDRVPALKVRVLGLRGYDR